MNEDGSEPMTVKALRKILSKLPDESIIITEDGNYVAAAVSGAKICRFVAIGTDGTKHAFVSTEDQKCQAGEKHSYYSKDYPDREFFELKYPILCFDIGGVFRTNEE